MDPAIDNEEDRDSERILGDGALTSDGTEAVEEAKGQGRDLSVYMNFNRREPGDSSDEEDQVVRNAADESETFDESKAGVDSNEDSAADEALNNQYVQLGDDGEEDFGDFESFPADPFADDVAIESTSAFMQYTSNEIQVEEEDPLALPLSASKEEDVAPSIPPLTQEKIDAIKKAMFNFTLKKPPGIGTEALLNNMNLSKLRVGDELP